MKRRVATRHPGGGYRSVAAVAAVIPSAGRGRSGSSTVPDVAARLPERVHRTRQLTRRRA